MVLENDIYSHHIPGLRTHDNMKLIETKHLEKIKTELTLSKDHVICTGYPKTGSTQLNEIIYMMKNKFDIDQSTSKKHFEKCIFIEMFGFSCSNSISSLQVIKSHLPIRYFEKNITELSAGPKLVVAMRNPKDTLVSYYHFYRSNKMYGNFKGTWDEFFEMFKRQEIIYGDIFEYNKEAWLKKEHPNVHIVKFEDVKKDFDNTMKKLAEYLDEEMTEMQLANLKKYASFDNMSKTIEKEFSMFMDPSISNFFRKGIIGDWCNYFSSEQSEFIDDLCKKLWEPIGLYFDYNQSKIL